MSLFSFVIICSQTLFPVVFRLHVAAARGLTECLSVILAHGVDLSITDAAGRLCIHDVVLVLD